MGYRIFYTLFLTIFFSYSSNGQKELGINYQLLKDELSYSKEVSLLIKGDKTEVEKALHHVNGYIRTEISDIFSVALPSNRLNEFLDEISLEVEIESPFSKGYSLMDTSRITNNIDSVHDGEFPLQMTYTGKGVLVGIIDDGIYFQHDDFKNPDGSTRIRYIWDQFVGGSINPPSPYNYGQEWNWIDIDNGVCTHVEPSSANSHGTNVAGIACGNGSATGTHKGVAPESEMIVVRVNYNSNFLARMVDAVDYIFKKADALGKPCVINTSVGTYFGSHDGKDFASQAIEYLLEERPGRAIVAAAGNGNNINSENASFIPTHLGYDVTNDTSFTWFSTLPNTFSYFELWTDTADFNEVNFSIGVDDPSNWSNLGNSDFLSIKNDFQGNLSSGVSLTKLIFDDSINVVATIEMFAQLTEGRYHIEFLFTPNNIANYCRFSTTGSGSFDIWSSGTFQGTSNMIFQNLPSIATVPDIIHYKLPDNRKSIVSSWQCSDKVITVGNYISRSYFYDVDSTYRSIDEIHAPVDVTAGEIYYKSSEGPTRDNRLKPDISSTGNIIFCSGNQNFINLALNINRRKVAPGAKHTYNGGTSMSSPMVAGAVALYLEKNPSANWQEIKEAIITSAKRDVFTGPNENSVYGHGKLNAFQMMQFQPIYGCMDSASFNFNPMANVDDDSCIPYIYGCTDSTAFNYEPLANTDDSSCIPIVYGCLDSLAINYNPLANIDTGDCEYPTDIDNIFTQSNLNIYPNPVYDKLYIDFKSKNGIDIQIYSITGRMLIDKSLQYSNNIDVSFLSNGVYILKIELGSSVYHHTFSVL